MKKSLVFIAAASLMVLVVLAGCGFLSGTVFISQEVNGSVRSSAGTLLAREGGPRGLDSFGGAKVYLLDNSTWQDIDIDGIEDICVRLTATNHRPQPVSGEVWVTVGLDSTYTSIAEIEAASGFRVFYGIALQAGETRTFSCSETLDQFENLDKLVDAVKEGVFWVWGRGDQDTFDITYEAIYLGMHVTGSL